MRLHMWIKAYKSAENIQESRQSKSVILAEPQVLRQWDDVAKKYTDGFITGYKYTFTLMVEDVLAVKFANEQDIKQWDVGYIRKPLSNLLRGY